MKKNMSNTDRGIRLTAAVILASINLSGIAGSPYNILIWIVVAIFGLTAFIGNCPVYSLFGINTCHSNSLTKKS